jgi:hypothetical protein
MRNFLPRDFPATVDGGLLASPRSSESLRAKPFSRMASPPISGDILVLTLAQRLLGGFDVDLSRHIGDMSRGWEDQLKRVEIALFHHLTIYLRFDRAARHVTGRAVFQHWLLAADLLQRQLAAFVGTEAALYSLPPTSQTGDPLHENQDTSQFHSSSSVSHGCILSDGLRKCGRASN